LPLAPQKQFIGANDQTRQISSEYLGRSSHNADTDEMSEEENGITFAGRSPSTLFREFAAECIELARTTPTPEKRKLYLKMASVWHEMAQRWEKKS
jgi:hypothetical protein